MSNLIFYEYLAPYCVDMLNSLHDKAGFQVFFLLKECPSQNFDNKILQAKLHFSFNSLKLRYKNEIVIKKIYKLIKQNFPRCIITPEFSLLTLQVILLKFLFFHKMKIIVRSDDSFDMLKSGKSFSIKHEVSRKLLLPIVNNVIVCDKRVSDFYLKRYKKGIFFPIIQEDNNFRHLLELYIRAANDLRELYHLKGFKVVLFVGRLVKCKNLEILLKSFDNIKGNVKLVIVGDGVERESLQKQTKNSNVIFTGRLEGASLYSFYNIADIFVLPSTVEPFGAVTNEALIGGAYSIVSYLAGSSCLIRTGQNGYVFNPYDVNELSVKMQKILDLVDYRKVLVLRSSKMLYGYKDYENFLLKQIQSCCK